MPSTGSRPFIVFDGHELIRLRRLARPVQSTLRHYYCSSRQKEDPRVEHAPLLQRPHAKHNWQNTRTRNQTRGAVVGPQRPQSCGFKKPVELLRTENRCLARNHEEALRLLELDQDRLDNDIMLKKEAADFAPECFGGI